MMPFFRTSCKQGIIERVSKDEEGSDSCYFLPHHGVVREDKETTKLRVVFLGLLELCHLITH